MTVSAEQAHQISQFVQREGLLLDQRDWSAWLDLYAADAEYWVPMWDDDGEPTRDPQTELSLIYYDSRSGLEDRVARILDGRSAATMPPARTAHIRSSPLCEQDGALFVAKFAWATHAFRLGRTTTYYGQRTLWLSVEGASLKIVKSHALVANDVLDQVLDIYHI